MKYLFHIYWLRTYPRFNTEVWGNSAMAYISLVVYYYLLYRHECFTGKYTTRKFIKTTSGTQVVYFP